MWKYIVIWVLVSEIPTTLEPATNEFGQTSIYTHSVYHFTLEEEHKNKLFDSKEEAYDFYKKAKEQEKIGDKLTGPGDRIKDVHIYKVTEIELNDTPKR